MDSTPTTGRPRRQVFERFWEKVDTSGGPDCCWPWLGTITEKGYGKFRVARGLPNRSAHQMAYLCAHGPIAPGQHLDHTCHSSDTTCTLGPDCTHRRCCNPAHLEPVSALMNSRRGHPRPNWSDPETTNRVQFSLQLDAALVRRIERYAQAKGIYKTEAARRVLDRAFSQEAVDNAVRTSP